LKDKNYTHQKPSITIEWEQRRSMANRAKIIPSIRYKDCEKAIEWLCEAFGFEKHLTVPGDAGSILHAQLVYNDCMIMFGSAHEGDEFGSLNSSPSELEGQNTASIYMVVVDVDAHYKKAVGKGAEIVLDIRDEDYGGRGYTCKDLEFPRVVCAKVP
jgi:uncharacterized glyoxalase superfamily protein PhnB